MPPSGARFHPSRAVAVSLAKLLMGCTAAIVAFFIVAGPASASAVATISPASSSAVTKSPTSLVISSAGGIDAARSTVVLRSSDDKVVVSSRTERPSVTASTVSLRLPSLQAGVYTTTWTLEGANGAVSSQGSSAFTVDPTGASPALVTTGASSYQLVSPSETVERWSGFIFLMTFLGAIFLRFLVSAPIARRLRRRGDGGSLLETNDRRLFLIAGISFLAFIPATLSQLIEEYKDPTIPYWQSIKPGAIADFLADSASGNLWLARLILTVLAAIVVLPVFAMVVRKPPRWRTWWPIAMGVGAILGSLDLLCATLPSKAPPAWPQEVITFMLDWGHLMGASVWIGGLIVLPLFVGPVKNAVQGRAAFWPQAIQRFSTVATISAGVMILTGLWTFWLHVGMPDRLLTTLYGKTLLVKLVLVAILMGIGAFNQFWLVPKAAQLSETAGVQRGRLFFLVGHFRRVVALEAFFGIAILFIVPFLSNSARNQDFQHQLNNSVAQVGHAGSDQVGFTPSGLAVGPTNYAITVPDTTTGLVSVTFSSPSLGVPATVVPATEIAPGEYQVSGLYTGIAGNWQARVSLAGTSGTETTGAFHLAVAATPPAPVKAASPTIQAGTWGWIIGDLLVVCGSLFGVRRFTRRRRPAASDDSELLELATVGE